MQGVIFDLKIIGVGDIADITQLIFMESYHRGIIDQVKRSPVTAKAPLFRVNVRFKGIVLPEFLGPIHHKLRRYRVVVLPG